MREISTLLVLALFLLRAGWAYPTGTEGRGSGAFREMMAVAPPEDAIVLLSRDSGLSEWRPKEDDKEQVGWNLAHGVLEIVPGTGSIVTKRDFRDFHMHLEFNVRQSTGEGQERGNSGVYIQQRYEVQILDSYGVDDYTYGDCGSVYRLKKPDVNACRPPGEWQSYDIVLRSARWDDRGNKIANARITVIHNGIPIHDNVEVPNKTGMGKQEAPTDGPIELQDHDSPVKFRNIWIRELPGSKMRFGLVTYLWGRDWDLPTLIANCEKAGVMGVELRTTHAHGVEPSLSAEQREEVKKRFARTPVVLVGLGSDEKFDTPDPEKLARAIETTKEFINLSYDVGGTGVKVKPDSFHEGVPPDSTIEQIGRSLNALGEFAADYDQQVRLEVHGECAELPTIKSIMDIATHPNVAVCWNCNEEDLHGSGLEYNFNLVKDRLGDTVHVREFNAGDYSYQQLVNLLVKADYSGWVLMEARGEPEDRVEALIKQCTIWQNMVAKAQQLNALEWQMAEKSGVIITDLGQKLRVEINGNLFTEYHFQDVPRPYFYPVVGPTGHPVIRRWPMKESKDEEQDHTHHRSLWYTHGDVNGYDFWTEGQAKGTIVHDRFLKVASDPEIGIIQSRNEWTAPGGEMVCTDTRTHRFYDRTDGVMMDFDVTVHASHGEITFGDTKEGSMAIRVAPTMRVTGPVAQGHIVNSENNRDGDAWGKRAAWCDYCGPVSGRTLGVAIFDHPQNPRHPTWWHVREYGLFAANPFGVHDFEGRPEGTGDLTVPAGDSLTFRYRLYIHEGDHSQANVAELYREYAVTE